jgi:hypothetical protein
MGGQAGAACASSVAACASGVAACASSVSVWSERQRLRQVRLRVLDVQR